MNKPKNKSDSKSEGLSGWLAFFVFTLGVSLILNLFGAYSEILTLYLSHESPLFLPSIVLTCIYWILIICINIYTIYSFLKLQSNAVYLALCFFIILLVSNVTSFIFGFVNVTDTSLLGGQMLFKSIIYTIIWGSYLLFSNKVKVVFPPEERKLFYIDKLLCGGLFLVLIILWVFFIFFSSNTEISTYGFSELNKDYEGFLTYQNDYLIIKYPKTMNPSDPINESVSLVFVVDHNNAQLFRENYLFIFFDANGQSLQEFNKSYLEYYTDLNSIVIETKSIFYLNQPAIKTIIEYTPNFEETQINTRLKTMHIVSTNNDVGIIIQYTAPLETFDVYYNDVEKSIESLRFFE